VKLGKQIRYAARKSIPCMWFLEGEQTGLTGGSRRASGEQHVADPDSWCPPEDEVLVRIEQTTALA